MRFTGGHGDLRTPFVSVNCAAIPRRTSSHRNYLDMRRGAFTGATQLTPGRFELPAGRHYFSWTKSVNFPAETQVALLRVLQEHEFERGWIGRDPDQRPRDFRPPTATWRPRSRQVGFRSDLFYRLNVFPIEMPPLRKRSEDIPLLIEYFLDRYARKAGKSFKAIANRSLELLQSYPWPGNIRELQKYVIERSVIVTDTDIFSVDESWLAPERDAPPQEDERELPQKLTAQEKDIVEAALRDCKGRVSGAIRRRCQTRRSRLDPRVEDQVSKDR